ncbi:hypothetical protein [Halomonas sp. GFAJ-1]|uniref:hypothetical protein n=1 Tax=Halomonas sp. GFAJ-1 TaxID=1118153 RepID=UPI00023A3364|nr:hypothetical protein [Halomonas sp. GFAJ-1]AVI63689.1 hypothetical protein BB497_13725 [Halomonas sp. GFAJ-1]EHK62142.1 hypothetical protein MOY_02824 [Halomonas sp. GFAJ-1]
MENHSKEHFANLNRKIGRVIDESFASEHGATLTELFQFSEDLNVWLELLSDRTDRTILISAVQEFELGFQAVVGGQYRYAFIAQRYFLEQICRFIYLSTNELHLRHWKLGLRDISWGALSDKENGVLSKLFIRAFYPEVEVEGEHLITIASKLYRESSEFIHGNFSKLEELPSNIEFNSFLVARWIDFMGTCKLVALFLLFMRFSKDIDKQKIARIEDMAKEELGGIEEFNLLFAD